MTGACASGSSTVDFHYSVVYPYYRQAARKHITARLTGFSGAPLSHDPPRVSAVPSAAPAISMSARVSPPASCVVRARVTLL